MDYNLKGRKVLITGAGDGIGRSLALAFGREGARVAGCARTQTRLEALSTEIEENRHLFHRADLTQLNDIQQLHDQVTEHFGGLDILINNAGSIIKPGNFFEVTDEDWADSFNINLMAVVRLCRLFIPVLRQSAAPRIINISSIAAMRPGEIFPHYSAIKAGLSNLTVSLAQTLARDSILVNSVSPGPVWSRSWENEARESAEQSGTDQKQVADEIRANTGNTVLLRRMGVPEDVTGIVLFLASDLSRWITGTNFTVDGGVTLNPY